MSIAASPPRLYREGEPTDLRATFDIAQLAVHSSAVRMGVTQEGPPGGEEMGREWTRSRGLLELLSTLEGGSWWVCEDDGELVAYGRVCRFGAMEELTELMVLPSHQGRGIGRSLLERCWPGDPSPDMGRVVVAVGAPTDLTLYTDFGVMPITGHWHMRASVADYEERRSQEIDASEPSVHMLGADRAVSEWNRLEPPAIGHRRPLLHGFFAQTRSCLATMDEVSGRATALCWVGADGQIGPAVGAAPSDLVPVVLAALDRVAKAQEPDTFGVYCATDSWWLLRRLRRLGFRVHWPSWVMCSLPIPGLDRYLPTRPPYVL